MRGCLSPRPARQLTAPSLPLPPLVQLVERREKDRQHRAVLGPTCAPLHGNQARKTEHAQRESVLLEHDGVREDLVVALALAELAEHIEDTEVGLEINVTMADERVRLGGQAPVREVEAGVGPVGEEKGEQASDVLRCTMSRSSVTMGAA